MQEIELRQKLTTATEKLVVFAEQENVATFQERIQKYLQNPYDVSLLDSLRNILIKILTAEKELPDNPTEITPASIAHEILLILAELHPTNDKEDDALTDPVMYTIIPENNRIYTSTGYCYDIDTIVASHNKRNLRTKEGEVESKYLLDPLTNKAFHPRDTQHILEFCAKNKKEIQNLQLKNEILNPVRVAAPSQNPFARSWRPLQPHEKTTYKLCAASLGFYAAAGIVSNTALSTITLQTVVSSLKLNLALGVLGATTLGNALLAVGVVLAIIMVIHTRYHRHTPHIYHHDAYGNLVGGPPPRVGV